MQYNQHWAEPTKTKIIWIGLLYSVLCLAMLSHKQAKDTPPEFQREDEDLSEVYRIRTAQCLIIADIHKPVSIVTLQFLAPMLSFSALINKVRIHD